MKLQSPILKERSLDLTPEDLLDTVVRSLDGDKADDIVTINLAGKSSLADYIVVVSGNSNRHVGAMAAKLLQRLKDAGVNFATVEGMPQNDWALIDAGDVIVHIFKPETRQFYDIEGMWGVQKTEIRIQKLEQNSHYSDF